MTAIFADAIRILLEDEAMATIALAAIIDPSLTEVREETGSQVDHSEATGPEARPAGGG